MTKSFTVRIISSEEELLDMFRLRYEIYCILNKWRPTNRYGLEIDSYDTQNTVYFGVFNESNRLEGSFRLNYRPDDFMIDHEFQGIANNVNLRREEDTGEYSRLAIRGKWLSERKNYWRNKITMLLIKASYRYCREHAIRFCYAVMFNKAMNQMRQRGFNLIQLAPVKKMQDGGMVEAAIIDWVEFAETGGDFCKDTHQWITAA